MGNRSAFLLSINRLSSYIYMLKLFKKLVANRLEPFIYKLMQLVFQLLQLLLIL